MEAGDLDFATDGAAYFPAAIDSAVIQVLRQRLDQALDGRPGRRLTDDLAAALPPLTRIAAKLIGDAAFAVRAVAFDKTADANWSVAWHQDRTVAVRERREAEGFGPWSTKDGVAHAEPPVAVLAGMATLRLHLDECGEDNAPLNVALGSHQVGMVPADRVAAEAADRPRWTCLAQAGDVWAYSTLILHASGRARTPGRRRVLQVDFAAAPLPGGLEWRGIA